MANLSNINNKLIVTDGGNLLVNATANLATYGGITIDNFSDPSIAMKTTGTGGWLWTQYITSSGTNNFSMGVNQSSPYWCVKAGAGMDSPHLVVDSSGDVGIGTITPDAKLTIGDPGGATTRSIQIEGNTSVSGMNGTIGYFSNALYISNNYYYNSAQVHPVSTLGQTNIVQQTSATSGSNFIDFNVSDHTDPNNAPDTRMRILDSGNVGIGTVTPSSFSGYTNLSLKAGSTGNNLDFFNSAGTRIGAIVTDGSDDVILEASGLSRNLIFKTDNAGTFSEKMRIQGNGNVGIGTSSPQTTLEVVGETLINSLGLKANRLNSGYDVAGDNADIWINYEGYLNNNLYYRNFNIGDGRNGTVATFNGSTKIAYFQGNVGIGTTAPQGKLDSVAPAADLTDFGRATGSALNIRIGNAVGYLGQINFCNTDAPAFGYGSIGMVMTSGSGVGLGDMVFGTKGSGSAVVSTERMRITSAGEIKAKPATSGRAFFSTQDPGNFSIAYTAYMVNASTKVLDILWYGSTIGSITVNSAGSGVDYNTTSSDERLKKNITNWDENILDKFKDIKPKEFNFKNQEDTEEKIKGYIAQNEVDKFPEAYPLVYNEEVKEDRHLFNPSGMVVYLMKAIQELKADNDSLKARIEILENK